MPNYYVTVKNRMGDIRKIGPLFCPSAGDAEREAKAEMTKSEKVIDVGGADENCPYNRKKLEDVDA
jgi:hypothetical protein